MLFAKGLISTLLVGLAATALADEETSMAKSSLEQARADAQVLHIGNYADNEWTILFTKRYYLRQGTSFTPVLDLSTNPLTASHLKAEMSVMPRDYCAAGVDSILVAHTADQQALTRYPVDANGVVDLKEQQAVYKVSVGMYQNMFGNSQCLLRLSALPTEATPPAQDPVEFEFAGSISYQGGFRHRMVVNLESSKEISRFWARVPSHCPSLDVIEAGTIKDDVFTTARLVDRAQHIYQVGTNGGDSVDSIVMTFNGPGGQACDIPIYVLPKAAR